jgi:hypothetical protein
VLVPATIAEYGVDTGAIVVPFEFVPCQCHTSPEGAVAVDVMVFVPHVLDDTLNVAVSEGFCGRAFTVTATEE